MTAPASARNTELVRSYRDGASIRELGRRYGISRGRVWQILVQEGIPRRPALKPVKADPATAWRRLVEGEKAIVVAQDYGYAGVGSLYAMLRKHGYKPNSLRTVEHGSLSKYTYGCRCQECRAAKSEYARDWANRAREELEPAPGLAAPARTHGLPSTYNRGCRCDRCRAAKTAYRRTRRGGAKSRLSP